MSDEYFEEEEFTTQFNGKTALRILALAKTILEMAVGFLVRDRLCLLAGFVLYLPQQTNRRPGNLNIRHQRLIPHRRYLRLP